MTIPQEIINALVVVAATALLGIAGILAAFLYLVATTIRLRADVAKMNVKTQAAEVTNEQENERTLREIAAKEYNRLSDRVEQMSNDLEKAKKIEREATERALKLEASVGVFDGQLKHYITLATDQSRQLGTIEGEAKANKLAADERIKHLEESIALKDENHAKIQFQLNAEIQEKNKLLAHQNKLEDTIEGLNRKLKENDETLEKFESRIAQLEEQSAADRKAKETAEIELQKAREEIIIKDKRIAELEERLQLMPTPVPTEAAA